jgi:hypothetical protein
MAYPGILLGGVQQIQLWAQGRENEDLRAGVLLNLQMGETSIVVRFLRMYFPRIWEFNLTLSKLWYSVQH